MKKDTVTLAHGGGGRLTREFINNEILPRFGDGPLRDLPDGALLPGTGEDLVFSTDSFVVRPLEFPGGNIGDLAIHGTVNDIAVSGGRPLWMSIGLILEEGLPMELLRRILDTIKAAADACGVGIVTGDTKVVEKGLCDGMYINSAGIGRRIAGYSLSKSDIRKDDAVLASGTLGDHGMAILAARENINIKNGPVSDSAPVHRLVMAAEGMAGSIRFMRDPTRGGAAAVLNEIAGNQDFGIVMEEQSIPLSTAVRAVSEMLGMEPLHMASEGRILLVCSPEAAPAILKQWHAMPEGKDACRIGTVSSDAGMVIMKTITGGRRLVDVPRGELLPRIC